MSKEEVIERLSILRDEAGNVLLDKDIEAIEKAIWILEVTPLE